MTDIKASRSIVFAYWMLVAVLRLQTIVSILLSFYLSTFYLISLVGHLNSGVPVYMYKPTKSFTLKLTYFVKKI